MRAFNVLFFGDSLKRFVDSLDYPVYAYDFVYNVVTYESTFVTMQVMIAGLVTILYFENILSLMMLWLGLISFYNRYHKRVYVSPEICYARNIQFL